MIRHARPQWRHSQSAGAGNKPNRTPPAPRRNILLPAGVRHVTDERAAVMTKAEEYRARAQECELRARQVKDREIKQQFLELARQWRHMADQWAKLERQ
jgi:hypothetical protein